MSEQQPDQGYYDQEKVGDERSLYGDLHRSRDFGEQDKWPDAKLRELGTYWKEQLVSPERSARAKKEIDTLLSRTAFELVMRQNDIIKTSMANLDDERIEELA